MSTTKSFMAEQEEIPLRAIELTGEVKAAWSVMNRDQKRPRYFPGFLYRRLIRQWEKRMNRLESELIRRGLLQGKDVDLLPG